jgi:hypothetical protein
MHATHAMTITGFIDLLGLSLLGRAGAATYIKAMEPPRVSADARYLAAWNEINARIAQRQSLITIYTSLALAALGAPLLQGAGGLWRLCYAVGPLSVLFAMLLRMHERMIQLLRRFLEECEGLPTGDSLPRYYAATERTAAMDRARRAHDWVCFCLVLGINGAAGVVLFIGPHAGERTDADSVGVAIIAATAAAALWLICRIPKLRSR